MNLIREIFLTICNMSFTAGIVILLVLLARQLLRKSPKVFSYMLWGIVAFRLICPFSFSSKYSLFSLELLSRHVSSGNQMIWDTTSDLQSQKVYYATYTAGNTNSGSTPSDISDAADTSRQPSVEKAASQSETTGQTAISGDANAGSTVTAGSFPASASSPDSERSAESLQEMFTVTDIMIGIWISGIPLFLTYQALSGRRLNKTVATAVKYEDDIYECDSISVPFVMGFLRPKIYLPFRLNETERKCILQHERYHIRRHDHQVKVLAILLLGVYWFNPLVWIAYYFMCRDMEMSCDEHVLLNTTKDFREPYSRTLLGFATGRKYRTAGALAFGETSVKSRIKNILHFKSPGKPIIAVSIIICLLTALLGCGNVLNQSSMRNKSGAAAASSDGTEYEYRVSSDIKSMLLYQECYTDGELTEYRILQHADFTENGLPRKGNFTVKRDFNYPDASRWNALFSVNFGNALADFSVSNAIHFSGMAENYYLENTSAWADIVPDEEIVLAAWHFDDGEGVSAFPCSEYMDKARKPELLSQNSGDILYYLVFSRKTSDELLETYSVSERAKELYQAKNPYLGDVVADETILQLLNLSSFGEYTIELNTSGADYGITINFAAAPLNEYTAYDDMLKKAALFLILTDNAEYFEWTYPAPDETEVRRLRCTAEKLEEILQIEDIKSFSSSEENLQIFLTEYLQAIRQHYELTENFGEKAESPDGTLYQYTRYVIGKRNGETTDNIYKILTNEEAVTMADIEEAVQAGGKSEKLYILKEISSQDAAESSASGSDGFLAPDGHVYKYKSLFTGRHPNAASDSTYLVYANDTDLTFDDITNFIFGSTYPKERQMYIIPQPE
ncbi:MAG: M56 family metallopeptidase [Bariatricus sp.]